MKKCFLCNSIEALHKCSFSGKEEYICEEHYPFLAMVAVAVNNGHEPLEKIVEFYNIFTFMMNEVVAEYKDTIGTSEEYDCDKINLKIFERLYERTVQNTMLMTELFEVYISEN